MNIARRPLLLSLAAATAAAAALFAGHAGAQTFPDRSLRIVVPFTPGGATDALMRAIAAELARPLKQTVIVDNRAGGGGIVGAQEVMRSPADGYTLLAGNTGTHVVNPLLKKASGYDATKDFVPLSFVMQGPLFLAVYPGLNVQTLADLVALGKQRRVTFGSPGNAHSLMIANLASMTGAKFDIVPYKGPAQAQTDVMAGHVDAFMDTGLAVLPHTQGGKMRLLAIAAARRPPNFPQVPVIAESYPGYAATANIALFAKTGTPQPVVDRLQAALHEVVGLPAIQKLILDSAGIPVNGSGADVTKWMQTDAALYKSVIEKTGVTLD